MPIGATAVCAYEKCRKEFIKTTHNQKYHDNECCKIATSEKALARYYEKKARRGGVKRVCATPGCSTIMSRYNDDKICNKCYEKKRTSRSKKIIEAIS